MVEWVNTVTVLKSMSAHTSQWCNLTYLTTCPEGKLDVDIGCPA